MSARVFAHVALSYLLALPVLIVLAARATDSVADYTFSVTMTTASGGLVQVFYDTGRGFSEEQSLVGPLSPSPEPRTYSWRLQRNRYRSFRIDPGNGPGRYTLHRVAILDTEGSLVTALPLDHIVPIVQLRVVERTPDRLVVETPADSSDAQLLCTLDRELTLLPEPRLVPSMAGRFALAWLVAFAAVSALSILLRPLRSPAARIADVVGTRAGRSPRMAIVAVAVGAATLSMYPVVFLGRSLVSPDNGGSRMLYDGPPFVPGGSREVVLEDTRGSDTAAGMYAFVPYAHVQREALAAGEWPLWNRYNGAGRPLWGQGQTFILDPLHWLAVLTPDLASGLDLKLLAHRTVFATGIGFAALAATGAWLPSALVTASAPFLGFYAFRFNHPGSFALTYAPWAQLGWFLLARATRSQERARAAVLLALATSAILLASPPKEGLIVIIVTWETGGLATLLSPGPWAERGRRLFSGGLAGVAAVLLTTPHWLVFLDTLKQAVTPYDNPGAFFAGPPYVLSLFLGPFAPGVVLPGMHAFALVMVIAAITAPRRLGTRPLELACALVAAGAIGIAFGAIPQQWLLRIPLIAHIVHVHDVFLLAAFPLVLVVCVVGVEVLLSAGWGRSLLLVALCAIAGWTLFTTDLAFATPVSFEPFAAFIVLSVAALLPALMTAGVKGRQPVAIIAVVLASAALLLPGGLHVETGVRPLDALLLQPRPRVPLERASPATALVHRLTTTPTRVAGVGWALFPGSQSLYGFEGIGGPDALALPLYEEFLDAARIWRGWTWVTLVEPGDVVRLSPLLDMLNVEFLVRGVSTPETTAPGIVNVPVPDGDFVRVQRRTAPWPRAFFVDGVSPCAANPTELLGRVAVHGLPMASVDCKDRPAYRATRDLSTPSGDFVAATGYVLTTNTTRFHVQAPSAGVVVLGETYLPSDFRVTLNGRRADFFRVNHAFKGVVIPSAGEWDVAFQYRPARWNQSLALAGLGLAVVMAMAIRGRAARPATEDAVEHAQ